MSRVITVACRVVLIKLHSYPRSLLDLLSDFSELVS